MIRALAIALVAFPLGVLAAQEAAPQPRPNLEAHSLDALIAKAEESGERWVQFLDRSTLFMGLYRLPKGAEDGQSPHGQDEVYYVAKGRGVLEVDGERAAAAPGAILFVAAGAEHRFVDIEEDLELVVFFSKAPVAPVESGRAGK
jgi:quercetin dioxygenase-like cupin family protein